jgi:hypothetical protein
MELGAVLLCLCLLGVYFYFLVISICFILSLFCVSSPTLNISSTYFCVSNFPVYTGLLRSTFSSIDSPELLILTLVLPSPIAVARAIPYPVYSYTYHSPSTYVLFNTLMMKAVLMVTTTLHGAASQKTVIFILIAVRTGKCYHVLAYFSACIVLRLQ